MAKSDSVVVYWTPFTNNELYYQLPLLDASPQSLMSDIQNRKITIQNKPIANTVNGGGYQACSAMHTFAKNTFITRSPIEAEIVFDKNGTISNQTLNSHWFTPRISSFEGSFACDLDVRYLLFSEHDLDVTLTPAYTHKAEHNNYGFVVPGQFNISSWLSRIPAVFQTWPGVNKIKINFNDPISYLSFNTDKKIELKQFKITENIIHQAKACGNLKFFKQYEPMEKLYERFKKARMQDFILDEIKKNLV
jgi:hypothetical protein